MSEAGIHFDFYRHLQNTIDDAPQRGARTYERVEPEYSQDINGRADLVVFDTDEPVLVIEAKRPDGTSGRDIDPYSPAVIRQAHGYASELGARFFATYNGERLVLFNTHEEGVPLLKRSTKSYDIGNVEPFASTLLDEIARLEAGRTQWDSLDEAFIERVRSLHEQLKPELRAALTEQLDHSEFHDSFVEWAGAQGIEYDDMAENHQQEVRERFAEEGAYLLVNKLIFYKILESAPAYSGEVRPLAIRENHARTDLETYFGEVVANVDFEAVFEHDDIYSEIPLSRAGQRISEFIDELDDQNLTQFDSDVIGRIYEGVIPPERRHDLGEYYTPPAICDLITRLTVQEADDHVLDPACGSGGFPVSAYHRKRDLLAEPAGSHERLLDEIYGIDINRFPAHLTAINLAIQELDTHTENVNIEVSDFFNVSPDTARFGRTAASASGTEYEHDIAETLGGFDAVVGNPPYIRQENIDDKERVRMHLSSDDVDGEFLSRRSDIYSYFITHGTEFLRDGGRLGFITSDRWLDTQYGEDVQRFILDNYEIQAVLKFDNQAFDDALVDSSVLILQKQEDSEQRRENVAKFLRLKQEHSIDEIVSLVEQDAEPDKMIANDEYRLVTRQQEALYHENKWNVYFFAPPLYFDIQASDNVRELSEIAEVSRGMTTGANPFFIGETEDLLDVDLEEYISPVFKATGQVDRIAATTEDASQWSILDVHDLVVEALDETDANFGETETVRVKKYLQQACHDALSAYIEGGERSGYHERSTLSSRRIWFDLGKLLRPRILSTMFTWRVHRVHWNEPEAATSDQFYYIISDDRMSDWILCAVLNSRITWLANELLGRRAGGQGMTRLQTKVYETEQWPVPDPRAFSKDQSEQIRTAFQNLVDREKELDEPTPEATEEERDALDLAIIPTLGLDAEPEAVLRELKQGVNAMVAMRDEGAGQHTTVLVERPQRMDATTDTIDLPGVSETHESTTLGDFE